MQFSQVTKTRLKRPDERTLLLLFLFCMWCCGGRQLQTTFSGRQPAITNLLFISPDIINNRHHKFTSTPKLPKCVRSATTKMCCRARLFFIMFFHFIFIFISSQKPRTSCVFKLLLIIVVVRQTSSVCRPVSLLTRAAISTRHGEGENL